MDSEPISKCLRVVSCGLSIGSGFMTATGHGSLVLNVALAFAPWITVVTEAKLAQRGAGDRAAEHYFLLMTLLLFPAGYAAGFLYTL